MKWLFILLGIEANVALSQVPIIEWQKCYGGTNTDDAWSIKPTSDNGYVILGYTYSNDGDVSGYHVGGGCFGTGACPDIWAIKVDVLGNLQWQHCLGGSSEDRGTSVIVSFDSSLIVSGLTESNDGDVNGNHGLFDGWEVKLDISGYVNRQRCFGGSSGESFNSATLLFDGGYLFAGGTGSVDGDVIGLHAGLGGDIWLVKTDTAFNIQWQKCIGGSSYEYSKYILQTRDGGYFLVGYASSTDGDITTTSHGGEDFWMCKLDSIGNIQWQKDYGGSADDIARSARQTRDGGFVIGGSTASNDFDVSGNHSFFGSQDYWLIKVDSLGDLQWQKCLGGTKWEDAFSIDTTLDGGILIAGISYSADGDITTAVDTFGSSWWIVNLDNNGNILWNKSLGGTGQEEAQAISTTPDGGCIITGYTWSYDFDVAGGGNHGGQDIWVVKLSSPYVGVVNPISEITDFSAYQNSVSNTIEISFYFCGKENVNLKLIDITGRILLQDAFAATNGLNKHQIFTGYLVRGIYFVRLQTNGGDVTKKLVVQ